MVKDLFAKCATYDEPQRVMAAGVYNYFRPIEATEGSTVTTQGKRCVMIGSNNYLGLTHHPKVRAAAKEAIDRFGSGCTGSRFLNGNLSIHEELEERLAAFLDKEKVLVYATGFLANQGTLSCLMGRNDVIYSDRENHASIVEGTRISLSDTIKFKHNDIEDLERILSSTRSDYQGAMIVADGVFSMSGDIFRLPEFSALAEKYKCRMYIDCAHALGVLGPKGQGTAHHFGSPDAVDIVMGTFSKSFASIGGFVGSTAEVINFVKHKSRPFMFSAALPPAAVASVNACVQIVQEEPWHLENLWRNARKMQKALKEMGYNILGSKTPIIPLLIGDSYKAFAFTKELYERGVFATPVAAPAVPNGCALIRTSYMSAHTDKDLDFVLEVLNDLGKKYGVLGQSEEMEVTYRLAEAHFGVRSVHA